MTHNLRTLAVTAVLLLVLAAPAGAQQLLTQFDLNHYEGWTYTRPGFVLNPANISNISKGVQLFKASDGTDYTLISPTIACAGYDSLRVSLVWATPTSSYNENYSLTKSSPVVELLSTSQQVLTQHTELLTVKKIEHQLSVTLAVPSGNSQLLLRLAAWTADYNSPGQVRSVKVYGVTAGTLRGDLNGDRQVNVSDVTTLVSMILASEASTAADINGDGLVNVSDVAALIDLCLQNQ